MTKYKTIRMTQEEYNKVKKARKLLCRKGVDSIPQDVFRTCPDGGGLMSGIKAEYYQSPRYGYKECFIPPCGYKEGQFNITLDGIALGAVGSHSSRGINIWITPIFQSGELISGG